MHVPKRGRSAREAFATPEGANRRSITMLSIQLVWLKRMICSEPRSVHDGTPSQCSQCTDKYHRSCKYFCPPPSSRAFLLNHNIIILAHFFVSRNLRHPCSLLVPRFPNHEPSCGRPARQELLHNCTCVKVTIRFRKSNEQVKCTGSDKQTCLLSLTILLRIGENGFEMSLHSILNK